MKHWDKNDRVCKWTCCSCINYWKWISGGKSVFSYCPATHVPQMLNWFFFFFFKTVQKINNKYIQPREMRTQWLKISLWTAGPEEGEYKYKTKYFVALCGLCLSDWWWGRGNQCTPQGVTAPPWAYTLVLSAEPESVKDINLNISHAWGTPHEENKAAHPCISQGTEGGFWGRQLNG